MKRNNSGYPKTVLWQYCFVCQKKKKNGLISDTNRLEDFANNLLTFWKYDKLELNWEALAALNEKGEPNFYDSFIKHGAIFHHNCFKRFDNQKVQRLIKNTKNEQTSSVETRLSQPKKQFAMQASFVAFVTKTIQAII